MGMGEHFAAWLAVTVNVTLFAMSAGVSWQFTATWLILYAILFVTLNKVLD